MTAALPSWIGHASLLNAAGAVDVDINPLLTLIQFALVTGLMLILKPMLFDPLLHLFEERERRIDGARETARNKDKEAAELLLRFEGEIERVTRVAAEERDKVRAEAQRLEAEEMAAAKREVAELLEKGRKKIRDEVQALEAELAQGTTELGREMASRVLGREVS